MAKSNGITFGNNKKKRRGQRVQGGQGGSDGTAGANPSGVSLGQSGRNSSTSIPAEVVSDIATPKSGRNRTNYTSGPGSPSYVAETNAINNANGQNTELGYIPNSPEKEATYTDQFRAEKDAINIPTPPPESTVNAIDQRQAAGRTGNLGATSINTPGTEFSVNKIVNPRSDGTTHNLVLGSGDNIQQGTVSANVAAKLGRGSGSFTQLDKGVSIGGGVGDGTLFGRPAGTGSTGSTGLTGDSGFAERANRSIGSPVAPNSAAQEFARFNQGSLNSTNPFKRAAANRQMKQALAIDARNAGIYKTNIVADTSRANTIDNINADAESNRLDAESASKAALTKALGSTAKEKLAQANKDRTAGLAERKFTVSNQKEYRSRIDNAVNLKSPNGFGQASKTQKISQLFNNFATTNDPLPKEAIFQIDPSIRDMVEGGYSSDSLIDTLREGGDYSDQSIKAIVNSLQYK